MTDAYFDSETYTKIDFSKTNIIKGEYDNCTFINCNFENIHASNIQFVACDFMDCNFSNAIVKDTAFKDVNFVNCKLIGVKFNECDPFLLQMRFKECLLNFSSFYQLKIPKTVFENCNLEEADFTEANIHSSFFDNCDLKGAIFETTNLEKTNFKTAFNFTFELEKNRVKGAKFKRDSIDGLLFHYKIVLE